MMNDFAIDTFELTMVAYFLHGKDMNTITHCSARFRATLRTNFIPLTLLRGELQGERQEEQQRIDSNDALICASMHGLFQFAQLLIARGATFFDLALGNACYAGHPELAQLMIDHGANDVNHGLISACTSGEFELARLMITHGARDFEMALYYASMTGRVEFAQLMTPGGSSDFNNGFYGSARHSGVTK